MILKETMSSDLRWLLVSFVISLNTNNELGYITIKMKTLTEAILAFFVFNYNTCIAKQIPPKSVSSVMLKYIMIFFYFILFFFISVHLAFFSEMW